MMKNLSCKLRPLDALFCVILLLLAVLVQQGRIGASVGGVHLATDAANYAAMAAATAHPEAFARDDAFSDPDVIAAHSTMMVRIVASLAENANYGLAYLKLTGFHVFFHYLAFYILGLVFFKKRWQALIFTILQGQVYWVGWGTYWGLGYPDYTPRTTFEIFYALYIVAALALLRRPRWWPVFMAAVGALMYVHTISTLPVALGFWLGFVLCRPQGVSRTRHLAWMFFCGLCFLAVAAPAIVRHGAPPPPLTSDDVALLRDVLIERYHPGFTYYWSSLGQFFLRYCLIPIFPAALAGAYCIYRFGDSSEKTILAQFGMWTLGVFGVLALFLLDQEVARALNRHHYEFDLVRVVRFLVFFAQCVAMMGLLAAMRSAPAVWGRRVATFCFVALCVGLLAGGRQDLMNPSLLWYWNSANPERAEAAYGPTMRQAAMLQALKEHTEPGSTIFYPREDLAIRHVALRALTHSWKDVGAFYYANNIQKLRKWIAVHKEIHATETSYIDAARSSGADYVLSDRPQDKALLVSLGPVVWEGDGYLLLRLAKGTKD